jgi:hypothetical protein
VSCVSLGSSQTLGPVNLVLSMRSRQRLGRARVTCVELVRKQMQRRLAASFVTLDSSPLVMVHVSSVLSASSHLLLVLGRAIDAVAEVRRMPPAPDVNCVLQDSFPGMKGSARHARSTSSPQILVPVLVIFAAPAQSPTQIRQPASFVSLEHTHPMMGSASHALCRRFLAPARLNASLAAVERRRTPRCLAAPSVSRDFSHRTMVSAKLVRSSKFPPKPEPVPVIRVVLECRPMLRKQGASYVTPGSSRLTTELANSVRFRRIRHFLEQQDVNHASAEPSLTPRAQCASCASLDSSPPMMVSAKRVQ